MRPNAGLQQRSVSSSTRNVAMRADPKVVTVTADTADPAMMTYRMTGPEPAQYTVGEGQLGAALAACGPFVMRAGMGAFALGYKASIAPNDDTVFSSVRVAGQMLVERSDVGSFQRPQIPLEFYEFEGCPFCKKVREAMSLLCLDPIVRPCPIAGAVWRPEAISTGGRRMFPFLVDPNTGAEMYESDDIISYLFTEYGPGPEEVPWLLRAGFLTTLTAGLGLLPRAFVGNRARKSRMPDQPLRLWMYEASPFVKLVREEMCGLELPYQQLSVPRGSPARDEMFAKYGHVQVPMLEDPNTGECLFESKAIMEYLRANYEVADR